MVAPAHRPRQHEARPPTEEPSSRPGALSAEGAGADTPLTSEAPLPDAEPLTSEPPLPGTGRHLGRDTGRQGEDAGRLAGESERFEDVLDDRSGDRSGHRTGGEAPPGRSGESGRGTGPDGGKE